MDKLSEYLKTFQELAPKFSLGLWLFGIAILLLPKWLAVGLRIEDIRDAHFGTIVLITAGAAFLWVFHHVYEALARPCQRLGVRLTTRFDIRKRMLSVDSDRLLETRLLERRLKNCSGMELAILEFCLSRNQDVVYLDWRNPAAQCLRERGIASRPDLPNLDPSKGLIVPFTIGRKLFATMEYMKSDSKLQTFRHDRLLPELESLFSEWEKMEYTNLLACGTETKYVSPNPAAPADQKASLPGR